MSSLCICLIGVDGVGKTTQLEKLLDDYLAKGRRSIHVHLRRPYLFSLPLLAYGRLRGFTKYRGGQGRRHGHWEFYKCRFLSTFFPLALLVDTALSTVISVHLPLLRGFTVVCDRCLCDTLVDLMLGLDDERYFEKPVGRWFLSLLPQASVVILLDHSDVESLRQRREDLTHDYTLAKRHALYRALAAHMRVPIVNTSQTISATSQDIMRLIGERD